MRGKSKNLRRALVCGCVGAEDGIRGAGMEMGVPSVPRNSGKGPGTWPNKRTKSFNKITYFSSLTTRGVSI